MQPGEDVLKHIIDDSTVDPVIRKQCKYIGCITLLNQQNAPYQDFCTLHQQRVILMLIDCPTNVPKETLQYYKNIIESKEEKQIVKKKKQFLKRRRKRKKSPFNGVHKRTDRDSYIAKLKREGKQVYLGHFKDKEMAVKAVREYEEKEIRRFRMDLHNK